MNFDDQIVRIQSAGSDTRTLALVVLDIVLGSRPPKLRRALEAAAVLRWFDETTLLAVLDEDLRENSLYWFEQVKALPVVEVASGREALNVHETTRRALREELFAKDPGRMITLAKRASECFFQAKDLAQIERAYHLAIADPMGCAAALRDANDRFKGNTEASLSFSAALGEYLTHDDWPHATRGWAAYFASYNRQHYRSLRETMADAELALQSFEACGLEEGIACALDQLGRALDERGKPGDAELALGHYERSLELSERLLAANPESGQAARDVSVSLIKLGDFLARRGMRGDLEAALGHYERSLEVIKRLLGANPESGEAARNFSVSLDRLGDFLAGRGKPGDGEVALGYYERSHDVLERLWAANPESGQGARDVSVSLSKLGDYLARRGISGDAEAALAYHERSLELREWLWAANPESWQAARDVSVSLSKLGDYLARRRKPGDLEAALGNYERSLEVRERLWAANPESGQAARDVSVSLDRLGDYLAGRGKPGDAEAALGHYERSLELRERSLAANPESGQAVRDVAVSLNKLGYFLAGRGKPGDAETALGHYERSLELSERLLAANPESWQAARDVSVSLERLGDFLAGRGKPGDAEVAIGHYERSLEARERWLAANPEFWQAARDVSVSLERLGGLVAGRGKPGDAEAALGHYERSLELRERLLAANPESGLAARDVSVSLSKLGDYLARRGKPGDAEAALGQYERSLEMRDRLLSANPESGQAARDVMVSLERMAAIRGRQAGGEEQSLVLQRKSLSIALELWAANPQSVHHGDGAARSYFITSGCARAAGHDELAEECLVGCYRILDALILSGAELAPDVLALHARLKPNFGDGALAAE